MRARTHLPVILEAIHCGREDSASHAVLLDQCRQPCAAPAGVLGQLSTLLSKVAE